MLFHPTDAGASLSHRVDKAKITKYHPVGTVPTFNRKVAEIVSKSIPLTHIHDRSQCWLDKDTSIKGGKMRLDLWA